jgi:hypothetical protein
MGKTYMTNGQIGANYMGKWVCQIVNANENDIPNGNDKANMQVNGF